MVERDTSDRIGTPTRRALLGSAAAGATGMVAGCSGGGGGDGDDTDTATETGTGGTQTTGGGGQTTQATTDLSDLAHVSGQTLTSYMGIDPQDMTWFGTGVFPGPQPPYTTSRVAKPMNVAWALSVWGPWVNTPVREVNSVQYQLFESVDVSDTEVSVKIRDDANWSNGDPVTSGDALAVLIAFRMFLNLTPVDQVANEGWGIPTDVITGYDVVSDKEYKLLSDHGGFGNITNRDIWAEFLQRMASWGGVNGNTSMEPYEGWWAGIQDTWDQAINGEIHPWTSQENHDTNIFMVTRELMFGDHGWTRDNPSGYENHWEEHFKNPDNVAVSGAWQPTSVNGSQSIDFEPNPEYVNADQVNFDKLKLVRRQSGRASRSALNANSQDYYAGDVPSHIAQSFPDDISQRFVPNNSGLAFQAKHTHPLFANRESRRAIQYAIDTERLAQSVHQTKFDPVSIPGGHGYTTRQTLGDDFVDNTLETYPRDLEKAGSLMQDAGFSREGGQWVDGDGDPLSIEITTPAETPTLEPTFASQLRSFGIQANLQTLSGANFQDQLTNAELDCWPTQNGANLGVGFALRIARTFQQVIVLEERYKQTRWYPQEQFDATDYAETGIITPANDAGHSEYSMRAPPVGEPGGANQEYKTALLAWNAYRAKSVEEYTESLRQLSWVFNRLMPMFPVANANIQTFVDDGHWIWPPEDSDRWQGVNTEALQGEHLMASANVFADPENPESGASVDE